MLETCTRHQRICRTTRILGGIERSNNRKIILILFKLYKLKQYEIEFKIMKSSSVGDVDNVTG